MADVAAGPPARARITDPRTMRALAHPARMAIIVAMQTGRAGTATEFAELCGLSPSATSYHLRALARAGLVEEAPNRGDGRERVWQSIIPGGLGLDVGGGPAAGPEALHAEQAVVLAFLTYQEARVRAWVERMSSESQEWYEASAVLDNVVTVTAAELTQLNKAIQDLVAPYRRSARPEPPPGARTVDVMIRLVPGEAAT